MTTWQDEVRSRLDVRLKSDQSINDALNEEGWTVLHNAVELESLVLIERLAASGADLGAQTSDGWTALHFAVDVAIDGAIQNGETPDFAICRRLVELGAKLDARNNSGETPRDIAAKYGQKTLNVFDEGMFGNHD
jgi:ankyrin repeat protein